MVGGQPSHYAMAVPEPRHGDCAVHLEWRLFSGRSVVSTVRENRSDVAHLPTWYATIHVHYAHRCSFPPWRRMECWRRRDATRVGHRSRSVGARRLRNGQTPFLLDTKRRDHRSGAQPTRRRRRREASAGASPEVTTSARVSTNRAPTSIPKANREQPNRRFAAGCD